MELSTVVTVGERVPKFWSKLSDWHDSRVLRVIEGEKAICTVDFIARNVPNRSRQSVERSIKRLEKAGKIFERGVGYVSSKMEQRIKETNAWFDHR